MTAAYNHPYCQTVRMLLLLRNETSILVVSPKQCLPSTFADKTHFVTLYMGKYVIWHVEHYWLSISYIPCEMTGKEWFFLLQ